MALQQPASLQPAENQQLNEGKNESSPFDIEGAIEEVLGQSPLEVKLPKSVDGVINTLIPLKRDVATMAVRLRRPMSDFCEERLWKSLAAFLYSMHNLEIVAPEMKTSAKLGAALELVFNPSHKFPSLYAQIAKHIYDELEVLNWGAVPVQEEEFEEFDEIASTTGNAAKNSRTKMSGQIAEIHLPADDDPIYGLNGIMHHILRIQGPKTTSYQINRNYTSKDAKVFGHNGFTVGECWPLQIALLRDGGHGQRMGGISGTAAEGTYSIVISGGIYDDLDKDEGDNIYYSGSNSQDNTSAEPVVSQKTKALERSIATRRPVRVFRTSDGKWKHCPSFGIRYDGLYTVVAVSIEENGRHGGYKRFTLRRRPGQDDVQINEPGKRLRQLFSRVRGGYSRSPLRALPPQ